MNAIVCPAHAAVPVFCLCPCHTPFPSSGRAYRPRLSREHVLKEIGECAGTQLCPTVVEAFRRLDLRPYDEMIKRHENQDRFAA